MKHSFATIKRWSVGMYVTVAVAIAAILGLAGYHLKLAYSYRVDVLGNECILGWYVTIIICIPLGLLVLGWVVAKYQNHGAIIRKQSVALGADGTTTCDTVVFHPHHWAIFYVLGFITRFDDPISNITAGIVVGSYMHGVASYGYGELLEPHV